MSQEDQTAKAGPLTGYRVLDFGWVLAGAIPGMVLADMGAEVLKVETRQRMDYMRLGRPIIGDEPDPEQHPLFHNVNRGKLSIALNTTKPEAIDLIKGLVWHRRRREFEAHLCQSRCDRRHAHLTETGQLRTSRSIDLLFWTLNQ